MVCQAEKDFVEIFLAALCSMEIKEIPFDNDAFNRGFNYASKYFSEVAMDDALRDKLAPLFIKQTTYGEYLRVQSIIEDMNGRVISLINSHFVKATINMDRDYVQHLLDRDDLRLGIDFYTGIAEAFCEGVKI